MLIEQLKLAALVPGALIRIPPGLEAGVQQA